MLLNIPSATDFSAGIYISFAGLCSLALPVVSASIEYNGACFLRSEKEEMVQKEKIRTSLFQAQQIKETVLQVEIKTNSSYESTFRETEIV